jgi:hypothetical protein
VRGAPLSKAICFVAQSNFAMRLVHNHILPVLAMHIVCTLLVCSTKERTNVDTPQPFGRPYLNVDNGHTSIPIGEISTTGIFEFARKFLIGSCSYTHEYDTFKLNKYIINFRCINNIYVFLSLSEHNSTCAHIFNITDKISN